ncbi:MAG: beta-galactosidase [Roseofilum sp. SBFL]|uniref:sugar-binding domain-containing protein n=1 Tax=unclassified Roseofilum TaxID=2620099 RepID=UPI001B0CBD9C|nr:MULTISPECIES: sugar-binding domain-containing protein [unclassified Roseofilum]MBP0014844.1 beta-galactosidase [Roseofilum sp. SID3]MBP0023442.1 beta-galactosidase [Roseofilum sp. SID2]MBP0037726.1 beta-galactosidase [Roseofilum sp. SID1]MBP0041420.1 beta-galactosidase [Roseofilum sp. SBFL]
MNKKLVQFLGLFCMACITWSCMSHWGYSSQADYSSACRTLQVTRYPALTEVPENGDAHYRDQVYLNGVWDFQPAIASTPTPPQSHWGKIRVPGDWRRENAKSFPGVLSRGTGDPWKGFNGETLAQAWYQKQVNIPPEWEGRRILLSLERVSTDANLYINNQACGEVNWPYGAVDITSVVHPGQENNLSLLVRSIPDDDKTVIMGPNEIYTTETKLASRGLIGEVRLLSIPQAAWISDVFVQPSTRKQQIKVDVELTDITQTGSVEITATMLDEQGKVEQEFTAIKPVQAQALQTLNLVWDWSNPRLWDVDRPNLYTLRLQVKGEGIEDTYDQSFGFREFWIEGKNFYLNGTEIRLRPVYHEDMWKPWTIGIPEVMDRMIQGYQWAGYNITELWPWNHDERGRWHFRELFAERADLKGFPIMAPVLSISQLSRSGDWNKPHIRKEWETRMVNELRRYRNHPSIMMWVTNPNYFGHNDDQNPRRIGLKLVGEKLSKLSNKRFQRLSPVGEQVAQIIKKHDPIHSVVFHQGASVGEVYTLNSYLGIIPLQEREQWLSSWVEKGDMPYMVVELGTPLHTTMMRGRDGFKHAVRSEPLMTEFSAIYLGKEAYKLESSEYRSQIPALFLKDQEYENWHFNHEFDFAPAFQKLQHLFTTNTWRSWRTFGITGGMIPWHHGHGWEILNKGREGIEVELVGKHGPYLEEVPRYLWNYWKPDSYRVHPGGDALLKNNASTLAWIAGMPEFTSKDHSFKPVEKWEKQVVLINDTREEQEFSFNWEVKVNGEAVGRGEESGKIMAAHTLFFPFTATLPRVLGDKAWDGEILLQSRIGSDRHDDIFHFRVFPDRQLKTSRVTIFDPVGKTTQMLEQLGYSLMPWDGSQVANVLVIGREVLSQGHKLPGDLENFVLNGGRVIVFTQNPQWIQQALNLRVAPHVSRRAFPVDKSHEIVQGLNLQDLRDWRGSSTLLEAYPDTTDRGTIKSPAGSPWYGWHWGNQGGISSASIEKPHLSSWRPILESEFDLAYTPLMELDYGQGKLIWNTLDLEDHVPLDAGATQLLEQIIQYSATSDLVTKADHVVLIGSDKDATHLDKLGLIYRRDDSLVPDANLIIIGEQVVLKSQEIREYLGKGGKLFFLPRKNHSVLEITVGETDNFRGSLNIPSWLETRGLSASDLRSRTDYAAWLIESGGEIGADGLLSRVEVGDGVAIFCQINPESLNADTQTYLRYTRWRQTRAIAQILANLGAKFKADETIFEGIKPHQRFKFLGEKASFYHPDYRTDFEFGDDPYRYYRW